MRRHMMRLIAGAAALAAFVLGATAAPAQTMTATAERAAALTIAPPRAADDVFLNVYVSAYEPPREGAAEAIVSVAPAGGDFVEIGRFTVFPAQPFKASDAREQFGYRLDASAALARLRTGRDVTVRVVLAPLDTDRPLRGATLTVARAEFAPRP